MNDGDDRRRDPRGSLPRLARELVESARRSPAELAARIATLSVSEQAELALRLPAAQRLELLLHAPRPLRLVRALPHADLYLTAREVGPADAAPLLALASAEQLLHLLDLESWRGDRFDADRAGAWIALLLEAGEPALKRVLRVCDDEWIALLLQKWIGVEQIDYEDGAEVHGHGQSETGTELGAMTPDGYHRFSPSIAEHLPAIRRILQMLYTEHAERYRRLLWAARWELPSELEEQALHWRQSRLEEHGFPTREEALSVYAAPAGVSVHPTLPEAGDPDGLRASRSFLMALPARDALALSIDALRDADRDRALFELLSLSNHVLVADAADTGDPAAHRAAAAKAAGYVRIALQARGATDPAAAGNCLTRTPIIELFRAGYAEATALQARARRLLAEGWAARHPRALQLLDSPLRERVDALLERRPRYLAVDAENATITREFASLTEVRETAAALEMAEVVGDLLFTRVGFSLDAWLDRATGKNAPERHLSAILLTALAWHATRFVVRADALPEDVTADFLRTVASRRTAGPDAPSRALEVLIRGLTDRLGLDRREIAVLQGFGRFCLERLALECSQLDPGSPLDARAVSCLWVA